ncbi:hypothetical protein [Spirosoma sp.]|uniref:hypothetical protein n=1 Tax=Spirosoma sp. TaxID=1899569 RepID=UPI003B3A255E
MTHRVVAQDVIEWSPTYRLTKADFQLKPSNAGNGQRYYAACQMDFSYRMSNYEFMFTKNFNRFSRAIFNRKASWMDEGPLTDRLLDMAQLDFDLVELYTRKIRKRMYEEKRAFSNGDFYQQAINELQRLYSERLAQIVRDTDGGQSEVRTREIHEQIVREINELDEYCKECKPAKKKG